jgi:hypothetical protein
VGFDEQSNDDKNSNSSVEAGKFKSVVSLDFVTLAVIFKDYSSSSGSTSRRFGDRHPLGNLIFSFFLHKNEKTRVILPRKGFGNRFFLHDRHSLPDFLDPPLGVR